MADTCEEHVRLASASFVLRMILWQAPNEVQALFGNAFRIMVQTLARQRQLSRIRFVCSSTDLVASWEAMVDTVCEEMALDRARIDPDRVVWVDHEILTHFLIRAGQWVNLRKGFNQNEQCFPCQILPLPPSQSRTGNWSVYLSPVTEINLRKVLNLEPFTPLPTLRVQPLLTDPVITTTLPQDKRLSSSSSAMSYSPINAHSTKLSRLRGCLSSGASEDVLIRDKFLINSKYLALGDIISCTDPSSISPLEFLVREINGKSVTDCCQGQLFQVTADSSKLELSHPEGSAKFHVRVSEKRMIAPCLLGPFLKLQHWIRQPLLQKSRNKEIWPSVLLHGSVGTGKWTVGQAVGVCNGFNVHPVNAANLVGDTSGYTEGKLRALQEQLKNSLCPVVVLLKNVHLLGKDKEGHEDKRIVIAFQEFLQDLAAFSSKGPPTSAVFIVGITNFPDLMVSGVAQLFLHKLEFPGTVSVEETEKTLKWLMDRHDVSPEESLDLGVWVRQKCAGLKRSYGDLKAFLAMATRQAFSKCPINTTLLRISEMDLDQALKAMDSVLKKATSAVEVPQVSWEDIGGLEEVKSELISSIRLPLEYPHLFSSSSGQGGMRRSGILLYGPPGTGKTLIAKAVASQFKLSFLSVKGPELLNMYVGQSEQNVRAVFERARNAAPSILFFDELDALAPLRGRSGDSGGVMDRVVSQILAELDGSTSSSVFVIGATNRPDLIDPALLRPGRFDKLLYVGVNSDAESKVNVLKAITRKFELDESVNLAKVAELLPVGMSGADLYALCSDAYMTAVERHINANIKDFTDEKVTVNISDFEAAITRASSSISEQDRTNYEELKKMIR